MKMFYKRPFAKYIKKVHQPFALAILDIIEKASKTPEIGERKKRDLKNVSVYKFAFSHQEYLIAYRLEKNLLTSRVAAIYFYQIGAHEGFYDSLKRYLREEKGDKQ